MTGTRTRLHYGWVVAAVTFAALLVSGGIRAAPGVLIVPLENEFHWSRATISFTVLLWGLVVGTGCGVISSFPGSLYSEALVSRAPGPRRRPVDGLQCRGSARLPADDGEPPHLCRLARDVAGARRCGSCLRPTGRVADARTP